MKALKFSFLLFGFFFFINANMNAQMILTQSPQVSMASINVLESSQGAMRFVDITISSNTPVKLAVAIYNSSGTRIALKSNGSTKTNHIFHMLAPDNASVVVKCGYIDASGTYRESDGGCTIIISPYFP